MGDMANYILEQADYFGEDDCWSTDDGETQGMWTTRSGHSIAMSEMSVGHLRAAIAHMERHDRTSWAKYSELCDELRERAPDTEPDND